MRSNRFRRVGTLTEQLHDEVAIAKVARKVQRSPVTRVFEPVDNLGQILLRARVAGGKKRGRKRRTACAA